MSFVNLITRFALFLIVHLCLVLLNELVDFAMFYDDRWVSWISVTELIHTVVISVCAIV